MSAANRINREPHHANDAVRLRLTASYGADEPVYPQASQHATVAQANKTARIAWAVLARNEPYRP